MMKKRLALLALVIAVLTTGSMLVGFIPINQITTTTSTATPTPTTTTTTTTSTTATTKANLNLRASASATATKLTTIPKGKTVTLIEKSGDWYKITYSSYTGYVMASYLSIGSSGSSSGDTSASGTATTKTNLIMRASASTSAKKVTTVAKGKTVTILGKSGSWYKVKYGSYTGYMLGSYLTIGGSSSGGSSSGTSAALGKVGHVKIPNTKVDYNIMLATDNEYYLTRDENGKKNVNGAIFMDYRNRDSTRQRNIITYGHNMKSGAMYRTLHSFNTKSFMTTNQDITVELFGVKYKYRIFAAGDYYISSFKYRTQFDNTADFMSYINNDIIKKADVTTGWTSNGTQDILTMSTCINDKTRRWIVFAYRVGKI
jgi:SrtB family sortase